MPVAAQQYLEDMAKREDDGVPIDTKLGSMQAVLMVMTVLQQHIDSSATILSGK